MIAERLLTVIKEILILRPCRRTINQNTQKYMWWQIWAVKWHLATRDVFAWETKARTDYLRYCFLYLEQAFLFLEKYILPLPCTL